MISYRLKLKVKNHSELFRFTSGDEVTVDVDFSLDEDLEILSIEQICKVEQTEKEIELNLD